MTVREYIREKYGDKYILKSGEAALDLSVDNGVDVKEYGDYRYGKNADIYPYVKWSDGVYKPVHYWGDKYYVSIELPTYRVYEIFPSEDDPAIIEESIYLYGDTDRFNCEVYVANHREATNALRLGKSYLHIEEVLGR